MAEALLAGLIGSATAAATIVTVAKWAIVVYGLYSGYQTRKAMKNASDAALQDRTVNVSSTDMPRSIVYGERVVSGRLAYAVEPRETAKVIDGLLRPVNRYFYAVIALEPDHEIDGFVELLFNGQPVGPWYSPMEQVGSGASNFTTTGSRYFRAVTTTHRVQFDIPNVGASVFVDPNGRRITRVHSVTFQSSTIVGGQFDPSERETGPNYIPDRELEMAPEFDLWPDGKVWLSAKYSGKTVYITYDVTEETSYVKAWFYRGTDTQISNDTLRHVSGGEWNSRCRLRGIPYVVVEILPDVEMFPQGLPQITAVVRGKKLVPIGSTWPVPVSWSDNAALCLYDYMRTELNIPAPNIDINLAVAAASACNEYLQAGGITNGVIYFEKRYAANIVLSTEATPRDNMRMLLACMAGTCVYAGGRFDMRAGVAQVAQFTLNENDLASDQIVVRPELPEGESANCVRGRYVKRSLETKKEIENGAEVTRQYLTYVTTDFPPYKSPVYTAEDGGIEIFKDVDLPGVTSATQAQRIALLQLRQSRNSLSFEGTFKEYISAISAGQVVAINLKSFGWENKPFYLVRREQQPDRTFKCSFTEVANSIFDINYSELANPDPSPNTRLTPSSFVDKIQGLKIESGPDFAVYHPDGRIEAYAMVTWERHANVGVAYGGFIEVEYAYGEVSGNFTKMPVLPGDATEVKIPISRGRQIVVRVRAMNSLQIYGQWETLGHFAANVPTEALSGNLLVNPEFESTTQIARPDANYNSPMYVLNWSNPYGCSPEGTLWSPGGFAPGFDPIPSLVADGDGNMEGRYIGMAGFGDMYPEWSLIRYVESQPVDVEAGARMVCYADYTVGNGVAFIGAKFYMDNGAWQTQFLKYSNWDPNIGSAQLLSSYKKLHAFFEVIPNARQVSLLLGHYRHDTSVVGTVSVSWYHPFLGYASTGQTTLPPWLK